MVWFAGLFLTFNVHVLQAIEIAQIDSFPATTAGDGTTRGWGGNRYDPEPVFVENGGPNGAGDGYIEVSTPTIFPFHLATRNSSQWSGDYLRECVSAIEMDLNHIQPDSNTAPVYIRLVLFGAGGAFTSSTKQFVTPNIWEHHVFSIAAADLVPISSGTGNLDDTLKKVTTLMIRHDIADPPTPVGNHPEHIDALLGIDNIKAISICPYKLAGDTNCDCVNNLLDFAESVATWLIDCSVMPADPACEPTP